MRLPSVPAMPATRAPDAPAGATARSASPPVCLPGAPLVGDPAGEVARAAAALDDAHGSVGLAAGVAWEGAAADAFRASAADRQADLVGDAVLLRHAADAVARYLVAFDDARQDAARRAAAGLPGAGGLGGLG